VERRAFVSALAVGILHGRSVAHGQDIQRHRVWRVGVLWFTTPAVSAPFFNALRAGLRERGYEEGLNLVLEQRFAERNPDRYAALAADLVRIKIDVIVAGNLESARAAQLATQTIPIVLTAGGDPVRAGLVRSLSHPGANITGMSEIVPDLAPKLVQILKEALPRLSRVAVIWDPSNPSQADTQQEMLHATKELGIRLRSVPVTRPVDFQAAFSSLAQERPDGLIVYVTPITQGHRVEIVTFAATQRIAAIYSAREFVAAGGLMSYGPNHPALFRHAAGYVDRLLKGANAADLPIQQPTNVEFVVNVRTAKVLNLTLPPRLLLRADEVIE